MMEIVSQDLALKYIAAQKVSKVSIYRSPSADGRFLSAITAIDTHALEHSIPRSITTGFGKIHEFTEENTSHPELLVLANRYTLQFMLSCKLSKPVCP